MFRRAEHWGRGLWSRVEPLYPEDQELNARPGFSIRTRILLAVVVAVLSGAVCYYSSVQYIEDNWAGDFTWALSGAEYLLSGENPYQGEYPMEEPLLYPLPAVIVAIPFTSLSPEAAAGLFFGLSSGLLAFAVTRYGYTYLPLFISAPYLSAMLLAQWTPLLMVAAFIPALLALVLLKPSLGIAIFASWPNKLVFPVAAAVALLTLIILPSWPLDWLDNLGANSHPMALLVFPGFLVLLALPCWRRRDARFLLLLALIPQRLLFYDQLLLWLVTRSARQGLYFALTSWLGFLGWVLTASVEETRTAEPWVVTFMFLPATVIVLINGRSEYAAMLAERWRTMRRRVAGTSQAES